MPCRSYGPEETKNEKKFRLRRELEILEAKLEGSEESEALKLERLLNEACSHFNHTHINQASEDLMRWILGYRNRKK